MHCVSSHLPFDNTSTGEGQMGGKGRAGAAGQGKGEMDMHPSTLDSDLLLGSKLSKANVSCLDGVKQGEYR
jgi:hypothetical protein